MHTHWKASFILASRTRGPGNCCWFSPEIWGLTHNSSQNDLSMIKLGRVGKGDKFHHTNIDLVVLHDYLWSYYVIEGWWRHQKAGFWVKFQQWGKAIHVWLRFNAGIFHIIKQYPSKIIVYDGSWAPDHFFVTAVPRARCRLLALGSRVTGTLCTMWQTVGGRGRKTYFSLLTNHNKQVPYNA